MNELLEFVRNIPVWVLVAMVATVAVSMLIFVLRTIGTILGRDLVGYIGCLYKRKGRNQRRNREGSPPSLETEASPPPPRAKARKPESPTPLDLRQLLIELSGLLTSVGQRREVVDIYFGTNRQSFRDKRGEIGFYNRRDPNRHVHFGKCRVFVPRSHQIGSLGSSFPVRTITRTDDRIKLTHTGLLTKDEFWQEARQYFSTLAPAERHAVVFIHGYNVSFRDAAVRSAQLSADLNLNGIMAFFSWASRAHLLGYTRDEATVEASEDAIKDFILGFTEVAKATKVHLIVHSMGNRAVAKVMEKIANDLTGKKNKPIQQIILAAADIDVDTFRSLAKHFVSVSQKTTIYSSKKDFAVRLSKFVHGFDRLGFHPPLSIFDNIDTVCVSNMRMQAIGHGYVVESRPVLTDIFQLLSDGKSPSQRFGVEQSVTDDGRTYWSLKA